MLAENLQKQNIEDVVDGLDEKGFHDMLRQQLTDESQRFMEATALASDTAFKSMLEQGLFGFHAQRPPGSTPSARRSSSCRNRRTRCSCAWPRTSRGA